MFKFLKSMMTAIGNLFVEKDVPQVDEHAQVEHVNAVYVHQPSLTRTLPSSVRRPPPPPPMRRARPIVQTQTTTVTETIEDEEIFDPLLSSLIAVNIFDDLNQQPQAAPTFVADGGNFGGGGADVTYEVPPPEVPADYDVSPPVPDEVVPVEDITPVDPPADTPSYDSPSYDSPSSSDSSSSSSDS